MITRRQFLLRSAASAAGFFTPAFVMQANQFIKINSRPFLEEVDDGNDIIFAESFSDTFELHLGEPYELPFELTVKGVLDFGEVDPEWFYDEVAEYYELEGGVDPAPYFQEWYEIHDQNEFDVEFIKRQSTSNGQAYFALIDLDLGCDFDEGITDSIGHIDFVDGCSPGNDYLGVTVKDKLSLSLLQKRLNELGAGYQIKTC